MTSPMTPERFFRHVEVLDNGCWRWTGAGKGNGYGIAAHGNRVVSTHRIAYEIFVGPIAAGLEVDHLCHGWDNTCVGGKTCPHRRCVNPEHLEAIPGPENRRRGQGFAGRQSRQTHCIHGHQFDDANTLLVNGHRNCRTCGRERKAQERAARRAA